MCPNQRNCLTIIKSEHGNVFGGYTDAAWINRNLYFCDENAFLFSLINKDATPLKMKCCEPKNAVRRCSKLNLQMYASLSDNRDLIEAKNFLVGSREFKTVEIEMYCKQM